MGALLLDTARAAEYCGDCSTSYLEKLRVKGGGPAYRKIGRLVRYRPADLDDWIEKGRRISTSDPAERPKPGRRRKK
jgi:hypothetical protein